MKNETHQYKKKCSNGERESSHEGAIGAAVDVRGGVCGAVGQLVLGRLVNNNSVLVWNKKETFENQLKTFKLVLYFTNKIWA